MARTITLADLDSRIVAELLAEVETLDPSRPNASWFQTSWSDGSSSGHLDSAVSPASTRPSLDLDPDEEKTFSEFCALADL